MITAYDRAVSIVSAMRKDSSLVSADNGWLIIQIEKAIREACEEREEAVRNSVAHEVARRLGIFERYPNEQARR